LRALALVFVFSAAVFAGLGVVLVKSHAAERRRAEDGFTRDLVATIQGTIRPEGLNVASILRWPSWRLLEDAILVDRNLVLSDGGAVLATGIDLNPLGVARRPAGFPREQALRAVYDALTGLHPVSALGGRAVPILVQGSAEAWGGLWYRTHDGGSEDYLAVLARMLPWFALSTVLLTAGTFLALRRLVLDPVAQLAEGARRVRAGDFAVRLDVPTRRDELAELVRSFNEMTRTVAGFNQRLSEEVRKATEKARLAEAAAMKERRLAAMGELAAGIAHEINNPLGGLQNAVEDLKRPELPSERRRQYLELLASGLARIGETVNRLRRFTPRESALEPVALPDVVHDALELVAHRARRLSVRVVPPEVTAADGARFTVPGLRVEIGQAVLNLLVNALDALEEGGSRDPAGPRIDVVLRTAPDGVRLAVTDNGPGVESGMLQRLGDLFYTTKEVGRGTGLGLALVQNAMRRHGGHLYLTSERGRSFRAELHFPRAPVPVPGP
jgi:signal transduction histidine kinase